jgi:hypothetical protein
MQLTQKKKQHPIRTLFDLWLLPCTVVVFIYLLVAPTEDGSYHPISITDLQGVWTSSQPQYQDRFLQFTDGAITFGWGDAGEGSYTIDGIESEPAENSTLVSIGYVDMASTPYRFSFFYAPQNGGVIWMKNQKGIYWHRTSAEPAQMPYFR